MITRTLKSASRLPTSLETKFQKGHFRPSIKENKWSVWTKKNEEKQILSRMTLHNITGSYFDPEFGENPHTTWTLSQYQSVIPSQIGTWLHITSKHRLWFHSRKVLHPLFYSTSFIKEFQSSQRAWSEGETIKSACRTVSWNGMQPQTCMGQQFHCICQRTCLQTLSAIFTCNNKMIFNSPLCIFDECKSITEVSQSSYHWHWDT